MDAFRERSVGFGQQLIAAAPTLRTASSICGVGLAA
jgi:hypothetical protein